jgi:CheY-like chemotaxis protein
MELRHKILLLDDDPVVLDLYKEILAQLPSHPEIIAATSGARAIALLEAEPYRLLICDLKMPKMDGLQVLAIVRRRFPELRTVVMTGVQDEEFRSRAYALGVDLFWLKPDTQQNMRMFLECLESLLGRDAESGFRGIQSKSLMDIIQMECLSQNSLMLRITRGSLVGRIWIQNGELVDAETEGARGERAFRRILSWKSGTFESLPPEPDRTRSIEKPVNALLLETAQAMDEITTPAEAGSGEEVAHEVAQRRTAVQLAALTRAGAEWVLSVPAKGTNMPEGLGTQATAELAAWLRQVSESCGRLSERLETGPLSHIQGHNPERRLIFLPWNEKFFLVAWPKDAEAGRLLEKTKHLVASLDA